MPKELLIIHPGGLSASCWSRLVSLLPGGTPVRVHELESDVAFWAGDHALSVEALARTVRVSPQAVVVGWGVGGAVADALAARHTIILDGLAPGAPEPDERELLRRFAMYVGARRGYDIPLDAKDLGEVVAGAVQAGALPAASSEATVRRGYDEHVRRQERDHRLLSGYEPRAEALTVVKAARGLAPESLALGWDVFGEIEALTSGGNHFSMLTDRAAAAQLAMGLARWLAPGYALCASRS